MITDIYLSVSVDGGTNNATPIPILLTRQDIPGRKQWLRLSAIRHRKVIFAIWKIRRHAAVSHGVFWL
jgi:hypothetical protein